MEKKADKPEELSSAAYCLAHCRSPSAPIERLQEEVGKIYQALCRVYILCRTPRASGLPQNIPSKATCEGKESRWGTGPVNSKLSE